MTWVAVIVAWLFTLASTPVVARWATARGLVDTPNQQRWHRRPTARLGGIAIFSGWAAGIVALLAGAAATGSPWLADLRLWTFVGATTLIFVLGLWDDLKPVGPLPKFAMQAVAVGLLIAGGLHVDFLLPGPLNMAVTAFWLLGVTNALNLVDNMNGLSSGLAVITAGAYVVYGLLLFEEPLVVAMAAVLAAAAFGFMPFNARYSRPALIFMGDSGSQFLGFGLAALGLMGHWAAPGRLTLGIFLPILALAVPLFDTTLAICARRLEDRPVSQGGRDHFSHRLVFLGLTEKQAVASLWLMGIAFAALAWPVSSGRTHLLYWAVVPPLAVGLYTLGVFLSTLRQSGLQVPRPQRMRRFQLGEVAPLMLVQDALLLTAAWAAALLFATNGEPTATAVQDWLRALPWAVGVTLATFATAGVYRRPWPGVSARDSLFLGTLVAAAHAMTGVLLSLWGEPVAGDTGLLAFATLVGYVLIKADRYAVPLWRELFGLWPLRRMPLRVAIAASGNAGLATLQRLDSHGVDVVRIIPPSEIATGLTACRPDLVLLADGETAECQHDVVEACLASGYSWLPAPS